MSTRRRGKIARLPHALREQVNRALRDGKTYVSVEKLLADAGHTDISEDNVRNWHNGHGGESGFQEWLRQQHRIEDIQRRREWALETVKSGDLGSFSEAGLMDAASKLFEVSSDFDVQLLRDKLDEDPELYLELTKAIARMAKPELEFRKFKEHVAAQKQRLQEAAADAKREGGISEETLKRIEEAANLL